MTNDTEIFAATTLLIDEDQVDLFEQFDEDTLPSAAKRKARDEEEEDEDDEEEEDDDYDDDDEDFDDEE